MALAFLFVFGAITLSFFDGFHTHSKMTAYPHPFVWEMAWWTPLLFGSVVAIGGWSYARLHPVLGGTRAIPSRTKLAIGFVVFGALYFASGYLPASNVTKLVVLVVGAASVWAFLDRSRAGVVLMIITAIGGCSTEITLCHFGAFHHLRADLFGIPMWLPGLYFASAPVIGHIARAAFATSR